MIMQKILINSSCRRICLNSYKYMRNRKPAVFSIAAIVALAYILVFCAILKITPDIRNMRLSSRLYAAENRSEVVKHILFVNSYHPGYLWSDHVQTGIMDVFINESGMEIDLRVEYLDARRYPSQLKVALGYDIAKIWGKKYRDIKFDLIVVSDQDGYNFLKRFKRSLFPGVPIVFCGVEDPGIIDKDTTGILSATDYLDNVELILNVLPKTKRIWIINDRSATGVANQKSMEAIAENFQDRVEFSFFDQGIGVEPDEVISEAEKFKKGNVIFFLDFNTTRSGKYIDLGSFLRELTDKATVPVFSHVDLYLDYGVTGGVMNSGTIQGRQAAEVGIQLLRGAKVQNIPPEPEKSLPAFNFSKVRQYGIPESALPSESRIINRRKSFISQYFWYLAGGIILTTLELILILWLFRLLRIQKQLRKESLEKEKILSQSENKYRTLTENASVGIWQTNSDGTTEYVNDAMRRILEVDSIEELSGKHSLSFFTPDSVDAVRVQVAKREMGESSTYEASIRGMKGTIRNLLITAAPLIDSDKKYIGRIASLSDVTDLKRAEAELKDWMHRYSLIVAASGQVVYEYILSTGDIIWGSSIENVFGYSQNEMKGGIAQWQELIHPDDVQAVVNTLNEALKSSSFWDERYRFKHRLGHYIWIRDRGFFLPDSSGHIYCQIGMMEDITVLKQAEEAMDFERRQLLSIFDSIDQIIYVSDPVTYEILFANKRLRERLGKNPIGGICYRELQGFDKPCDFCTNPIILENRGMPYKWEHYNPAQRETLDIVDRLIRWPDGREVRFEIAVDITERKRAEEALRDSEERKRALLNALPDIIFVFNRQAVFIDFMSSNTAELLIPADRFIGKSASEILPPELAELTRKNIELVFRTGQMQVFQYDMMSGDSKRYYESRMVLKSSDEVLSIVRDVTEYTKSEEDRERLRMQLAQAQKIESVGRLAGGIAHDFNNMLGAITGYSELALRKMDKSDPIRRYLDEILKIAGRSTDLTRQLLAFARQQVIQPKVINLNDTIESMLAMLRRLIGENINLIWKPCPDLWLVNIDPAQMDQILANLCLNARDAIRESGTISIETKNTVIDETYSSGTDSLDPGEYIVLAVTDNGSGMDRATRERIFEPFFTTKELGHGTGLGLATVYGIVKQNKGFINVYSEPGKGSSFKIYFPGARGKKIADVIRKDEIMPYGRGETILLAEDEPAVMEITKSILKELNYTVIAAGSPSEAISASEEYSGNIDLLITDVIMPEMNGRELSAKIEAKRPGTKTLFMSGYTADVIARQGIINEGVSFIQKPFSMRDIALKLKAVLEKGRDAGF